MLCPMKMKPAFKNYFWGGDTLAARYGKAADTLPVAESWEVSCYPGCHSIVENGIYSGKALPDIIAENPGSAGGCKSGFPVLVKLIDARQQLSLQVHPDDEYAWKHENQPGKNELWYIIDAKPGAELIMGLKRSVSKQEVERAIRENTILDIVNRVKAKKGDYHLIPAGLLHSIGGGVLIAEIQQSSDVTYRVYDYNRAGADGKTRPLHIKQAINVINCEKAEEIQEKPFIDMGGYLRRDLTDWEYFKTSLLEINPRAELFRDNGGFDCLLVTDGEAVIESAAGTVMLKACESAFIPAGTGAYVVSGKSRALLTRA